MKKLTGLITFVVVLCLVYAGYWFYQAQQVKELVANHLKNFEKADRDGYRLKVDNLSVGGFPLNYEVKLANPRYELANESASEKKTSALGIDGAIKVGSDVLGKTYWIKQEGDLNYFYPDQSTQEPKKFLVKGNMELKADVSHPQYWKAFMHPFHGFPQAFYKQDATLQEILNELKFVSYQDSNFALYEVTGDKQTELMTFAKGAFNWKHAPNSDGTEKFVMNIDLKDLETVDNGRPLTAHLAKIVDLSTFTVDLPYFFGSGKNNISMNFDASLPPNLDFSKVLAYKNLNIDLKNLDIQNLYGNTSVKMNLTFNEKDSENRNLHFGFSTISKVTKEGSEAVHKHFIESLKQRAQANASDDPDQKVIAELLKCCQDKLEGIIPDYTKLGTMKFIVDGDVLFKDVADTLSLEKVVVNHFDTIVDPYGIKSFGEGAIVNDQPKGQYQFDLINYQTMIHDIVSYYNRIYPVLEKFAEANSQTIPVDTITDLEEREIVDFFKSLAKDADKKDITIVIDFNEPGSVKIGHSSYEQVKQAWDKLVADLAKQVPPAKPKAELPAVKPELPAVKEESAVKAPEKK